MKISEVQIINNIVAFVENTCNPLSDGNVFSQGSFHNLTCNNKTHCVLSCKPLYRS